MTGSGYETYECPTGTLLLTKYTGTPHGTETDMLFIHKSGEKLHIAGLLPDYPLKSSSFNPREIHIDEFGERLTFVTNILEAVDTGDPNLSAKEWGDTLCVVDLRNGKMLSMQPLDQKLTEWRVVCDAKAAERGESLSLTIARAGSDVSAVEESYPGEGMSVAFDASGVRIIHVAALLSGPDFERSAYRTAYDVLRAMGLPDTVTGDGTDNTPEQREVARRFFQVALNGTPVGGSLWWSRGNNHVDLNFTFDEPLALADGDLVTLDIRDFHTLGLLHECFTITA